MSEPIQLYRAPAPNEEPPPEAEVFDRPSEIHRASRHVSTRKRCGGLDETSGRPLAEASLWLCVANFIATMDIGFMSGGNQVNACCDFDLVGSKTLILGADIPRHRSRVRLRIDPNKHDNWPQK